MRVLKNKDNIKNDVISSSQKTITDSYAPHGHEFFEIEYVIDGDGVYEIDGKEYKIAPKTLFFMIPTNVHAIKASNARIINIMFTYNFKSDTSHIGALLLSQPPCFTLDDETNDFLRVVLSEIVRVSDTDTEYAMTLLRCAIYRLVEGHGTQSHILPASSYVRDAILFIYENFSSNIGLEATASHVGLTASYFSDLFHKEIGVTFKAFLDDIRLSYAKKLLRYTALSVKEIHFRSGYCDYANFSRRFKQRYEMTPTAYRAQKNNAQIKI